MTRRRLAWLLRALGPELSAWPAGERAKALALVRVDAEARELLADAVSGGEEAAEGAAEGAVLARLRGRVQGALRPVGAGVRWGVMVAGLVAGLWLGQTEWAVLGGDAPGLGGTMPATVLAAMDAGVADAGVVYAGGIEP